MKLKRVNNALLVLILLVNGYVVIAPLLPALLFQAGSHSGKQQQLQAKVRSPVASSASLPPDNRLVIPSMLLDQPILDGPISQTYKILDKGIWRWPKGSAPDQGGNTVLIGHRFTYTNPRGVFYYLNKVKTGDDIGMFWNNRRYTYQVSDIHEVLPSDISIEQPTRDSRLTLFTCTPLWLPKNRLVVIAKLEAY